MVTFPYSSSEVLNVNLTEASKFCRKRQFISSSDIAGTGKKQLGFLKDIFLCQSGQLPLQTFLLTHLSDLDKLAFGNI